MRKIQKEHWLRLGIFMIMSMVLFLWMEPTETSAATTVCKVSSCKVNSGGTKVTVKAKVTKKTKAMGKKLYLIELSSNEKIPVTTTRKPVAETKAQKGTVKFTTSLKSGTSGTKLYSKFVVAYKSGSKYKVISDARYITNPEQMATYTGSYPKTYSKKGLQVENMQDSMDLGTQYTVLNWVLNTFIAADGTGEAYEYKGKQYYFNSQTLSNYDDIVHKYNESGSKVTVILLLANVDDSNINHLRFTGGSALYSSIKTSNTTSCRQFEAIMSYLGQRYGQKSHLVSGWILGNEIGNTKDWNYAGGKGLSSYMDGYVRAFRICNTAVKSVNKNAHVYLSLDYFWARDLDDKGTSYFSDKAILNSFYKKLKAQGLTDWYIAYHAYSQGSLLPEFWDDILAKNSTNAEIVNFNNMNVLTNYVKKNFGKNVKIMFSEQSFTDDHGELVQAAAYAYAYYKCEANSMVEAFIYGRHIDNAGEVDPRTGGAMQWGLRDQNYKKRIIWDIYQYIDSPDGLRCTKALLSKISTIRSWNSISGFNKAKFTKMPSKRNKITGLSVSTASYSSAKLTWNRDGNASGYEIYRADSKGGKYKLIATVKSADTTSYTDKKLTMGKTYYYKVRMYHKFATVGTLRGKFASTKVTVTVGPTIFKGAYGRTTSALLKWNQVAKASGYYIYRSDSENGKYTKITTITAAAAVEYTDTGLIPGNTYYYKIVTYVKMGGTAYTAAASDIKSAVPAPQKAAITTLTPGNNRITVQWNEVPYADGYEVYACSTADGTYERIKVIKDASTLSYRKTFTAGSEYYFKVRAYVTAGDVTVYGSYSKAMSARAYAETLAIDTKDLKPKRSADGTVTISWAKNSEAYAYQVWRSSSKNGDYIQIKIRDEAGNESSEVLENENCSVYSVSDQTASASKKWYYKIRIVEKNSAGTSLYGEWSSVVSVAAVAAAQPQTETQQATETEQPTETQPGTETEQPTETQPGTETEQGAETEQVSGTEQLTEAEQGTETEQPAETERLTGTEQMKNTEQGT